jgi:Tfp pilus assembly protein PilO
MTAKRQWSLITALLCLAILVGGFMFLVKPEHKKANNLKAQTATVQEQTAALRTKLAQLNSENTNIRAEQGKLIAVEQKIPVGVQLPALTRELDAAAVASNVDLVNVAPSPPSAASETSTTTTAASTAAGVVEPIPVIITISGSYFDVERFLDKLEGDQPKGLTRALLVDGFSIAYQDDKAAATPGTLGVGTGELTVGLQTRVFMTTSPLAGSTTTAQ